MVNIVTQRSSSSSEKHYVHVGKDRHWELVYTAYSFPSEEDREQKDVDESLVIRETHPDTSDFYKPRSFEDAIYSDKGKIGIVLAEQLGYSPIFSELNDLETEVIGEMFVALSPEAKALFEKGMKHYDTIAEPQ